jgi:manganese transport protein
MRGILSIQNYRVEYKKMPSRLVDSPPSGNPDPPPAAADALAVDARPAATTASEHEWRAWRRTGSEESLPEVHRSIMVPDQAPIWRKMLAFAGPGFLVAVGYMDPGNWATDLASGAKFGYTLLWIIMMSNLMAILLQHLCIKLGVATGRDLAQACRDHYSKPTVWFLWILCELAIAACDLAEVVGSAIGLQLLFGLPLVWGCIITCVDVLAVLYLQNRGFRYVEALVVTLIGTIGFCFAAELLFSKPQLGGILSGFVPNPTIFRNEEMLYLAIGILGATVMPHNLYLHSSIVQTRNFARTPEGRREAITYATIDSTMALMFALFINAAILIVSAAAFHWSGYRDVAEIQDAYRLLSPVLGVGVASTLFAVALLASGQNSTLTGTLAGQIVMEGFLNFRIRPWLRRLVTRLIAIVPAVTIIGLFGEGRTTELIVASQVILSLQLGFAVWPLMRFTNERAKMGPFVNNLTIRLLGWTVTLVIITLNAKLLFDMFAPEAVQRAVYGLLPL